jgi:hypothetical protein
MNLFCFPHSLNITGSSFRSLSKVPHGWSLGLVLVPVRLNILPDQLKIIGLVEPLSHQPPNTIKAHLEVVIYLAYLDFCSSKIVRNTLSSRNLIVLTFKASSSTILTHSLPHPRNPSNLHVLSIPQTFTLSQDQTYII